MNWIAKQYTAIRGLYKLSQAFGASAQKRSGDPSRGVFEYLFQTSDNLLSAPISQSERLATVATCIDFRARTRAMLPLNVFETNGSTKKISKHKAQRLLHNRPNPNMNAYQFWYAVEYLKHYDGDAFAYITRNKRLEIERFDLFPVNSVTVTEKDNSLYYFYQGVNIPSTDILHFKNFSHNGKCGISTLSWHAQTFGQGVTLKKFANRNLKSNPPAYATSTNPLPTGREGKEQLVEYLQQEMTDFSQKGTMPFLYNGFEIKSMGLKPAEAAYLEQISANKEDIYGIFGVSPGLLGSYKTGVTYSNLEQQNLQYLIYTLSPILISDEQELNEKVFLESEQEYFYTKFNEKALLRTDLKTQAEWLTSMFKIGAYNRNKILENLDENPVPGGDVYYIEGNNMVPLDSNGLPIPPVATTSTTVAKDLRTELQQVLKDAGISTRLNGKLHYDDHSE